MTHTPGPWHVGKTIDSSHRTVYICIESLPGRIATTGVYGRNPNGDTAGKAYTDKFGITRHTPLIGVKEAQANARLIAAAPDLLAALKQIALVADSVAETCLNPVPVRHLAKLAKDAIAKARGE